jgi:hypothetical protein
MCNIEYNNYIPNVKHETPAQNNKTEPNNLPPTQNPKPQNS